MKKILSIFLLISTSTLASEKEALMAIKALGSNLKKELQQAMKKSPIEALSVCNTEAHSITANSQLKNISLGRVSAKTRNPSNTPKKWMLGAIKSYEIGSNSKPHVLVEISKERMGIIKPIRVMPLCLNCHGSEIKPEIKKKISELYPADKATGYKNGDIRGYFWADFER